MCAFNVNVNYAAAVVLAVWSGGVTSTQKMRADWTSWWGRPALYLEVYWTIWRWLRRGGWSWMLSGKTLPTILYDEWAKIRSTFSPMLIPPQDNTGHLGLLWASRHQAPLPWPPAPCEHNTATRHGRFANDSVRTNKSWRWSMRTDSQNKRMIILFLFLTYF